MMSNALRVHLKLLSNYYTVYNKCSNVCLLRLRIVCLNQKSLNQLNSLSVRSLSARPAQQPKGKALSERPKGSHSELTIGEKVKQTTEDISYFGVILLGVSVTAVIAYAIFRELFSSTSPNVLYTRALKLCKSDPRVTQAIGEPIKGFGELTSRGRRRHVSSLEYEKDGENVIRVQFYLKGSKRTATVHLEAYKNRSKGVFRYLFVDLDDTRNVIILEDNRHIM